MIPRYILQIILSATVILHYALLPAVAEENSWAGWAASRVGSAWKSTVDSSVYAAKTSSGYLKDLSETDFSAYSPTKLADINYPSLPALNSFEWLPANFAPSNMAARLSLPEGWRLVAWMPSAAQLGPTIARLETTASDVISLVPTEGKWWRDFSITSGIVGTTVSTATFGCAVVSTPGGPVIMALAGGACGTIAAHGGAYAVQELYAWTGNSINEGAMRAGTITGSVVGSIAGSLALSSYLQWQQFRHFKDYAGYAKEARSLTSKTIRTTPGSVANLRANGYDIDHVIPVKCGWKFGIPAAEIASIANLHALPSSINRSIGAKGC